MAEQYDAIVVGSGACGGWASMALTQAGMRVLMLEAGSPIKPNGLSSHVPVSTEVSRSGGSGPATPVQRQ